MNQDSETIHRNRIDEVSTGRQFGSRLGKWIEFHAKHCKPERGCCCIPYCVSPLDPRPTVQIVAAIDRVQRWQ